MSVRILTSENDLARYSAWIQAHPQGSLWQSIEWKQFQESLRRQVRIYAEEEGGEMISSALVVIDRTSFGLTTWEIPRGPLTVTGYEFRVTGLLDTLIKEAKKNGALSLYCSPSSEILSRNSQPATRNPGHTSGRHVHPEATRILDLTLSDEQLLAAMKPKGRYNIGLAQKHGVTVRVIPSSSAWSAERIEE